MGKDNHGKKSKDKHGKKKTPHADGASIEKASAPSARKQDPGTDVAVEDVFNPAFFAQRHEELEGRVGAKRLHHIEGVADTAARLAARYGVDVEKARLAGLLHDWDKGYDDEGIRARVHELGMEDTVDRWAYDVSPAVLHGPTAARALKRDFPAIPDDVLHAIAVHTTAAETMGDLDKVLYIADALEPSRQFGRIDELRASEADVDLDELFFRTYAYWVTLLLERGRPLHPRTAIVYNAALARRKDPKGPVW